MLFDKETYTARRDRLKRQVKEGLILLSETTMRRPIIRPTYTNTGKTAVFFNFYGQHRERTRGGNRHRQPQRNILIGNDIDIEDIVWFGAVDSVADLAAQSGVEHSAPMNRLEDW